MTKQRRLCQLGVGTGLVTMVLGALMAIPTVAGAQHDEHGQDPHGNNGTVKIDGVHEVDGPGHTVAPNPDEQHPDNDPHVLCQFELEFFGFDEGQTADILISAHPPTGNGEVLADDSGVLISDDAAGGAAPDPDVVLEYDLSEELAGIEPHDVHGWHVKLDLTIYGTNRGGQTAPVPGGQKHKVFWIEDCRPSIDLVKTNDADRDGTFSDSEVAPTEGADVPFRLDLVNDGPVDLTLATLADTWGTSNELDLLALGEGLACSRDGSDIEPLEAGDVLPAGTTTTCFFTVEDYAPDAETSLTNTVAVTTDEGVGDEDTSTVTTPELSYSVVVIKENDADGDLDHTDSEQAEAAGDDVPFRIELRNTGTGDLTIDSLSDTWGESGELDLLDAGTELDCTRGQGDDEEAVDLVDGSVLPAGSTTVCYFTVDDYAPPAGDAVVNTVTVTTDEGPTDDDTSTVSTPPLNPTFTVALEKLNDANGDGTFSESEQAPAPGAAVTFQISIENTGTGHLTLESLVDEWSDERLDLLDPETGLSCTRGAVEVELEEGSVLPGGSTTVCTFSVDQYAPAADGSLTNTVTVDTEETEAVDDDSTVTTPGITPTPQPQPTAVAYSVAVEKLNDADGDGDFDDAETAEAPGADVEFELTIRNTGEGALVLESLSDRVPGLGTIDLLGDDVELECTGGGTDLEVGSILPVGSITVCTFELEDYAPAAGGSLTNTVTVVTDRVQDSDTSTVDTAEEQVVVLPTPPVENPPVVTPPVETPPQALPDQVSRNEVPQVRGDVVTRGLPRTGDDSRDLAGMGAFLVALGAAMVLGSRRQLARR